MEAHNNMKMRHTNTKLSLYFSKTHSSILQNIWHFDINLITVQYNF